MHERIKVDEILNKAMAVSDEERRVRKDIEQFDESIAEVEAMELDATMRENVGRARNYRKDAEYFLCKGDPYTAWGTINYAHGILDAVRRQLGLKCYGALE